MKKKAVANAWQEKYCHENQELALHGKDIKHQQIHAGNSEMMRSKLIQV